MVEKINYTVAVDLGTSNVVVAVGVRQADGLIDVVSIVSKPVEGVNSGKIDNIESVSQAIKAAVSQVEEQLGIRITEAYAGISGEFVRCTPHKDYIFTSDPQNGVNQHDVDVLFDRMRNVQAPDEETIMERVPQNYIVDDNQEVRNPIGSFGKRLTSTFNFILCQRTPVQRLDMALKRLGIRMIKVFPNTLSTPEVLLSDDEKHEGVAVVNLGGGVTDVTLYYRNVVRHIVSIPIGAASINRDIRTMSVPEKYVESLKLKYGSAVAELVSPEKLVRVNGRTTRDAKDILLRNLAIVIEARATDIAEFVKDEIRDSGYAQKLAYGVVLTGGSANLTGIDELFRRVLGLDVRIATPDVGLTDQARELVANPSYSTAVGLLFKGSELGSCAVVDAPVAPQAPATTPASASRSTTFVPKSEPVTAPPVRSTATPYTAPAPTTRPISQPGFQQPQAPQPSQDVDPVEDQQVDNDVVVPVIPPPNRRDWGSIFKKTIDKLNDKFTSVEDDEV